MFTLNLWTRLKYITRFGIGHGLESDTDWNRTRTGIGHGLMKNWKFGLGFGLENGKSHDYRLRHEFGRGYCSRTSDMGKLWTRISDNLWFESLFEFLFSEHFELRIFSKSKYSEKDLAHNI